MGNAIRPFLSCALAALATAPAPGGGAGPAPTASVRVLEDADPAGGGVIDTTAEGLWVQRARLVNIDTAALLGEAADRAGAAAETATFDLFADTSVTAVRRPRDLAVESAVWFGEIVGEPEGYVLIVSRADAFWGKVSSPSRGTFEIAYVMPGLASVRQVDTAQLPSCGANHRHEDRNVPGHAIDHAADAQPAPDRGAETGTFIFADVGIMYTAAARAALGSTAAMEAFLDGAIADANVAYGNSQITLRIRAAFKAETSYTQNSSDMGADLSALQNPSDGQMDDAHTLRNTYGADLVTLIVNGAAGGACGIGYIMTSVGPSFQNLAFNVVARTCVSGLTFPHELGHNMGCAHDRDNAGSASWPYAYGYRTPNNLYRTVMAYSPGTRVAYFSNPDVTYQGYVMGVPINQPNPCHNALAINNNSATIAAWRQIFTQPPGTFALLTPGDGETTADRTPDFTWEAAEQTDYFRLEVDNDPSFASPEFFEEPLSTNSFSPSSSPPITLQPGMTYYWRVTAINPLGSQASTPASRSFTTPAVAPAAFSLLTPADNAVNISRNPSFQWSLSNDTDGYTLLVDDDPAFASPAISASGLTVGSFTWFGTPLEPLTHYYWKVLSTNTIGSTPSTPAMRAFDTIGILPEDFNLTSPPDGSNIPATTPLLTWGTSNFADSYRVLVDDQQGMTSPAVDVSGLTATSYQVPSGLLLAGVRYYWQVRASNISGTTNSSPAVATFAIVPPFCQGDANRDGFVNFADISTVLVNWGGNGSQGDANGDGLINFVDISTVLSNWGDAC